MIHRLARRIAAYCLRGSGRREDDLEITVYGLECTMADLAQVLVLVVTACVIRQPLWLLAYCLCFVTLKHRIGGSHARTHLGCISIFTGLAVVAVTVASRVPLQAAKGIAVVLVLLELLMVWLRAPIAHPHHPKSARAHQWNRRSSLLVAGLHCCVLPTLALVNPGLSLCGALGGCVAACTLLVPVRGRGGEKSEAEEEP